MIFAVRAAAALLAVCLAAAPAAAQMRRETPSGLPVPRFVSLKYDRTNCRIGPSFDHPVKYVYQREGAPVLIIAESVDHWRKIADSAGDQCWAHAATLRAQTHILVETESALFVRPREGAAVRALLAAGVLAEIERRGEEFILVSAGGEKGWIAADAVWGGDARAAHAAVN